MRFDLGRSLVLCAAMATGGAGMAQPAGLQAGQWELTSTLHMTNVPSATRNVSRVVRHCLTPQGAKDGGKPLLVAQGCAIEK